MKVIKQLVDKIDEELEGAQEYAEKYVEEKANNDSEWANTFRTMSEDELAHANKIHAYAVREIDKLRQVYQPSQEMLDKWDESHKQYVERAAWIKQMLAL